MAVNKRALRLIQEHAGQDPRALRFAEAYLLMAEKARYRPCAPGDGLGSVELTAEQVRDPEQLAKEALQFARSFHDDDNRGEYHIGYSNFETNQVLVLVIEAGRALCGAADDVALALLECAIKTLKEVNPVPVSELLHGENRRLLDVHRARAAASRGLGDAG